MNKSMHITQISRQQNTEFGLVLVMICCLLAYYTDEQFFSIGAIVLCLLVLLTPKFFIPFTWIWFKFSNILGNITSTLLLCIIFFYIVTPVAFIRKLCKKDSLQLKTFKKGKQSVFIDRNHLFLKENLINSF